MTSEAPLDATAQKPPEETESKGAVLWREMKGLFWVLAAVLAFHSFIAKPFYIPSESMMPNLLTGDRLVVSKYPYGWSYVSPTIPNPLAIFRSLVFHTDEPWGVTLPFMHGRVFGRMPQRGDIVIVTPPDSNEDYIKRVIGLPGDTIELRGGRLIFNGQMVKWEKEPPKLVPIDSNSPCGSMRDPALFNFRVQGADGHAYCRVPIVRETLPSGVSYDTIDLGPNSQEDNFGPYVVPSDHVFLMGDNRDDSADSRVSQSEGGLGGAVPWENIGGRAEFLTFSLRGDGEWWNPVSWIRDFRSGRAGMSLRAHK
jgi:signal peptidase I